jgi:hypothetical protein
MNGENIINSEDLILALEYCIEANISAMVHGPAGIGKTEIIKGFCGNYSKKINKNVTLVIIPPGLDAIDLYGIPVPDKKKNMATWLWPKIWHEANDAAKKGDFVVFFIDEINTGSQSLLNALMGLINEGRLGDYVRPKNSWCVAAGNRQHEDRASVVRMTGPMVSRLIHFDLYPDAESWYHNYAIPNKVYAPIAVFIKQHPDSIYRFDPRKDERGFPNPRSWVMVSNLLKTNPPDSIRYSLIAGKVGAEEATRYLAFESMLNGIVKISEIKKDPQKAPLPDLSNGNGVSVSIYLATSLSAISDKENFSTFCTYMKRLPTVYTGLFRKNVSGSKPELMETKEYIDLDLYIENN